jgi:deazaflavin-dependent oxidoreductase (nitroreductase family)
MTEVNMNTWNQQIIDEFHEHGGRVGGPFEGETLLLLTTIGAKSGQQRVNPLTCLRDGERLFVFASKGGSPTNPDWYYNLRAHPQEAVEIGTERWEATAVILAGDERDQIYAREVQRHPGVASYEKQANRKIPVIELVRRTDA